MCEAPSPRTAVKFTVCTLLGFTCHLDHPHCKPGRTSYREPGGAFAGSRCSVTHTFVYAQTRLQATVAVESMSAGLVAVQARPAWLACAFAFHWMAAGQLKHRWEKKLVNNYGCYSYDIIIILNEVSSN